MELGTPSGTSQIPVTEYTERSQDKIQDKHVQLVRDYGFHPRSKAQVEDGSLLPRKFEPFPSEMYGRPIEEIDHFIYEETFCVVSKRFKKNYIHRFTGTKSLFLFPPWNGLRRICVLMATNQFFDYLVMTTILVNCIFLAKTEPIEEAEFFFLAIYSIEMFIKIIAKGFVLNKYTYLRNPWNWLDFLVITSGYATMGMDVGNLAGLRTFRVLRALKTISILPGLKTIINALLHSFKQLAEVMTLTIFCLMVFALFALQVYMGELRNKCVANLPESWSNVTDVEWYEWITNTSNWRINAENDDEVWPVLCGNVTGSRHCPPTHTCLRVGENPNHGYTSFDNFMWSMLTTFQLITLDYWENVYNMVVATCGPMSVSFFTIVVFFGSFYLINLMLAVVALSYEEEAEITQEERRKDLIDHRDDSTFSFDPTTLSIKQLSKQAHKRFDSKKSMLMASYARKKTRRRKKGKEGKGNYEYNRNNMVNSNSDANEDNKSDSRSNCSAAPTPNPSPRNSNSIIRPQALEIQPTKVRRLLQQAQLNNAQQQLQQLTTNEPQKNNVVENLVNGSGGQSDLENQNANTLHPLRGQLLSSRQGSSNRDSSLDDSGVVDDHEDNHEFDGNEHPSNIEVTLALSPKEVKIVKCNGNSQQRIMKKHDVYALQSDCLSQSIVVIDDIPEDRNCECCFHCCYGYESWLSVQNFVYNIVKDPLFELLITICIVLNTTFLALEHHGMSETVRSVLDIGNKVFTFVFTVECFFKLTALSKEFFQCGWNIFDLCIVTASILDLIFELIDGLSVLRGLRLLRVLKLAQSWITMRVLLSIILSTIGALGNLTFVLVIVIYIFAVIGMQLFGKDYTSQVFFPDPIPRWNFNDFFHSFMMIFRILCGEWIEPLWDCMRAEEVHGSQSSCFFIFLPALVMGNFMVLNLFLALLLNSFNSEELKAKKDEVGDESRLAKSFERIRSLMRKGRFRKEKSDEGATKLEKLVDEIIVQRRMEKKGILSNISKRNSEPIAQTSVREIINRPLSGINYGYEENYERGNVVTTISGSRETIKDVNEQHLPEDMKIGPYFQVVSSSGSINHHHLTKNHGHEFNETTTPLETVEIGQTLDSKGIPQQIKMRQSCPMPRNSYSSQAHAIDTYSNSSSCTYSEISKQLKRLSSNQSINTLSLEQDDLLNHINLKDELLNCDKKELFQFLREEHYLKENYENFYNNGAAVKSNFSNNMDTKEYRKSVHIQDEVDVFKTPQHKLPSINRMTDLMENGGEGKPWHCLVSYVDDLTVGGRKNSKGEYDDPSSGLTFGKNNVVKIPQDCFPKSCYKNCPCWEEIMKTKMGQKWLEFRTKVLLVVDTPTFEWVVLVLIFASSVTLCFEDIHLDKNKKLKRILYWTNFIFSFIFVVEMLMKWVAHGFTKYFTSFWTILDFIIVFVSVFSLLIEENENLKVLRSLRTLRALRPLRAISRWQGMRIVVNALMYAIPSIFNVLLVCLVFWLIFSIMGVQFFGGKFFKCVDENEDILSVSIVNDKWQCLALNYTWINSKITFDHVGMGYLALFQVATFEGWMEVMADSVDSRGVDLQPSREANLYAYIYFVIFIICGSFFTLNLFIGVIIDNFNMLKKKYEGGILEMFLTPSQKSYYCAMKKLGRKKPQKVIKRPLNHTLALFYDLANSRRFEIAIFVLIFLNMLSMGIEHFGQPDIVFFLLEVSNAFFTTVFGLECIVKIIGLRYHYFTVPWNMFDFLLVLASIFGILMEDIMIDLPISPTLLRVVRVFRIGRILRLIKAAKGIRKLLFALIVSLPALFNIGALLALVLFVYAIIGMSLFGHVKQQGALDDQINFETFGRSMQLLFRLMTSAGWNDVLESLMIQPPQCKLDKEGTSSNGDCGHPLLAITYFTSFIIISYMIVINMYIAIILENFNQAHQEEEIGIVEDDLEMFYIRWSKYDPHASQFISFAQLGDFLASLDPPLGIPKPNVVAIVAFNLPISKGDKIHCLDILHALVKHVLGHVDESDTFKQLQEQMDVKFRKQFPTRKEIEIVSSTRQWRRQEKAAKIVQTAWKDYVRSKRDRDRSPLSLEEDNTQTSSPGWHGKLSALNFLHLQINRRCSGISSRASSRKSSRASEGSDNSDGINGPWMNLPIMMFPGGGDMVKNLKLEHDKNKELAAPPPVRRRSIYNFFLGRQDALDDHLSSPAASKKQMKANDFPTAVPITPTKVPTETPASPPQIHNKTKRATSFIRKKPKLERGLSDQSVLKLNKNPTLDDNSMTIHATDVSILVTQPSPEVPVGPNLNLNQTLVHHVIVHRESEEYHHNDSDDTQGARNTRIQADELENADGYVHPVVTICVDSPVDEKPATTVQTPEVERVILERSAMVAGDNLNSNSSQENEPIDINLANTCDTSKIFYDY